MNLRFIRPEDRRRSGGRGAGSGFDSPWADTEPACFRSEAFAEDLAPDEAGPTLPPREHWRGADHGSRRWRRWAPALGSVLVAALGWRLSPGD